MLYLIDKIESLIASIKIILSKNGHLFSVEDIDLLNQCLSDLEMLKEMVTNSKSSKAQLLQKMETVIKILDMFFGLGNIIKKFVDN